MKNRYVLLLLPFIVLCGCGSTDDDKPARVMTKSNVPDIGDNIVKADLPGNGFYKAGTNSTLLSGGSFGLQQEDQSLIQKSLAVTVTAGEGFDVGRGTLTRLSSDDRGNWFVRWYVPVTNTSNQVRCGIKLRNTEFRSAAGTILTTIHEYSTLVLGSAYSYTFTDFTGASESYTNNHCLAPGSTAWAVDLILSDAQLFADLYWIDIEHIEYIDYINSDQYQTPTGDLFPTSYRTNGDYFVEVTFENRGTSSVRPGFSLGYSANMIALDTNGLPVYSGPLSFDPEVNNRDILPGETVTASTQNTGFNGSSTNIRVITKFDVVNQ